MDATIVIPTKNAGPLFDEVLDAVFSQITSYSFEVVCVDSGSSDETLSIIAKYPCIVHEIPPEEFGHGKTRNLGASLGSGEFIVFITQDATPASKTWLQDFLDSMKFDDDVVGAFGIHYAYPKSDVFTKRDLEHHFNSFGDKTKIFWIDDWDRWRSDDAYRHQLCFFSDNNACVRKSALEKYPYPDVSFAEDQIWMRQMMELGFKKVYCPNAPVFHSHSFPMKELYHRCFDEYKGLYEIHGYRISENWFCLPKLLYSFVKDDFRYVRTLDASRSTKLKWMRYSIAKNYCKCFGGYKGGAYHNYSLEKQARLEKKLSQQYAQRKVQKA